MPLSRCLKNDMRGSKKPEGTKQAPSNPPRSAGGASTEPVKKAKKTY
jgi:hypothetical protein